MSDGAALHERLRPRLGATPLVVLLDVDGTLSPIAPTPDAAFVPPRTRVAIEHLAGAPGVHVALVSGRAAADARRLVGARGVWAVGNHGFERITPEGAVEADPAIARWQDRIGAAASALAPHVAQRDGAILENKRWTLSIHYRQAPFGSEAELAPILERIAGEHGLTLTRGKMVFEIRPPVHVDKGTASTALVRMLAGERPPQVFYAGDDRTDEDAFTALRREWPDAITVRIAPAMGETRAASAAEFSLADVDAMGAFLERLAVQRAPGKGS